MSILDFLGGAIKPVTDLVDSIHTSSEEKLELKAKILEIKNTLSAKYLELESETVKAKRDIMVAELKQDDKYTKRARPTVVYGGLLILFINHVLLPWVSWAFIIFKDMEISIPLITLPDAFWIAWGGVCGVYAFGRTKEKIKSWKDKT